MKLERNLTINAALFNIVPLINVLFLVVIFFAMSSRFVLQPGMAVSLPASTFTVGPQHGAQIVSITSAPAPAIYFRDRKVSVAEFRAQLADAGIKQRSLIVKADRNTPYELVTEIMNEGLKLGFSVVLATNPPTP
jgi:biopolymer transport protein ExbD